MAPGYNISQLIGWEFGVVEGVNWCAHGSDVVEMTSEETQVVDHMIGVSSRVDILLLPPPAEKEEKKEEAEEGGGGEGKDGEKGDGEGEARDGGGKGGGEKRSKRPQRRREMNKDRDYREARERGSRSLNRSEH